MNGALAGLVLRSARGRVVRAARLLRRPRYLLGFLVGGLYFAWSIGNVVAVGGRGRGYGRLAGIGADPAQALGLEVLAALATAAAVTAGWIFVRSRAAFQLNEAEIHLLLTAPVPRRDVLRYAVLKSQPGVIVGAAVMSAMVGGLAAPARFPGTWIALTLFDLHTKGTALFKARTRELPVPRARRRASAVALLGAAFWLVVLADLSAAWPAVERALARAAGLGSFADALAALGAHAAHGPLPVVLAPFLWPARAVTAADPALRAGGIAAGLLLVALHHAWIVRSRARFEDATLERATRTAAGAANPVARVFEKLGPAARRRSPFVLRPQGPAWVAVFWKNLKISFRRPVSRTLGVALALLAAVAVGTALAGPHGPVPVVVFALGVSIALMGAVLGGALLPNDLRADLPRAELVRTWPVAPLPLVVAEVLSPALAATFTACFGLGLVVAADAGVRLSGALGPARAQGWVFSADAAAALGVPPALAATLVAGGIAPLLAGLALLSATLQNVLLLLLPGWLATPRGGRLDAANFGQRVLFVAVLVVLLGFALVPAALLAGAAVLAQAALGGRLSGWQLPPLGALASLVPLLESAALLVLAARLWARLDVAEVLES